MRVLIICNGRTGSSALMRGLAEGLKCHFVAEPWNFVQFNDTFEQDRRNFRYQELDENVVVKCLINTQQYLGFYLWWTSCPYDVKGLDWLDNNSELVFWSRFAEKFDKVILLDRKDILAKVKSSAHAQATDNWDKPYIAQPKFEPKGKYLEELILKEEAGVKLLEILSKYINIDITYYEDLYNGKMRDNYFDLPIDNEKLFKNYLDPKLRYRQ